MSDVSFGEWLKRRRNTQGLTQEQLALQINCSTSALRKIEAEERRPSAQMVELIAEVFNIPSSERTAFLRFARGDRRLPPTETIEEAPWHASTKISRLNLPATITSLVGREKEVALVHDYLLDPNIRIITLMGPPGIGKTRLSVEAARASLPNFPDGIFFVALAPLDEPSLIAPTIIQSLGFAEARNQPLIKQLTDGIGDKQLLLVMDNCEHLIEEFAPLASGLLSACPRLKILATSRESLRIPGEWLYSVPALDIPKENSFVDVELASQFPALTLFAERARAVRSDFTLDTTNVQAVASICTQLDGLPLAIELIAARMRLMSPQTLLERLNDQFVLSADGMRAVTVRQKTLGNAIGWSYNSLPPEEQSLFACLSVFFGSFTLQAAEEIFSGKFTNKPITDLITSLSDKSLLQRTLDAHGETRFTMLVTIQQFALDRLRHAGGENETRDRHLAYFLNLAEKADKEIHGPNQIEWSNRLESEHDNFHSALEWCVTNQKTEFGLRLLGYLCWPWDVRNHYIEISTWFDKIRALPQITAHPASCARLLARVAQHQWMIGDYRDAQALLEESQTIWLKLGVEGELGLANTLDWLGMVARWSRGDSDTAQRFFEQSFELYKKYADQRGIAITMFHLAIIADGLNQIDSALSLFEQSLTRLRQLGDLWGIGSVSQLLGQLFLKQGNYAKAQFFF